MQSRKAIVVLLVAAVLFAALTPAAPILACALVVASLLFAPSLRSEPRFARLALHVPSAPLLALARLRAPPAAAPLV
ncbi:MAG TPA: hypothetical protein VMU84_02265 [Thermoanaerobaculia bacterium]|nr:hypothetical protein [Thermoanaerobaculia bacterium]